MTQLTPTAIEILRDLDTGTLKWGAAVGAVWPDLVRRGYVKPRFGGITQEGKDFLSFLNSGDKP